MALPLSSEIDPWPMSSVSTRALTTASSDSSTSMVTLLSIPA
jgi:hypothetical protein